MSARVRLTPGAYVAPIPLDEVKAYLVVEHDEDDALIDRIIAGVSGRAERVTGLALASREYVYDIWSGEDSGLYHVDLPVSPVTAVSEVMHFDEDAVETELEAGDDGYRYSGDVVRLTHSLATDERVRITFTAGYETLEEGIKTALLEAIAHEYENRGLPEGDRFFRDRFLPFARVYA